MHVRAKPAGGCVVGRILLGGPLSRVLGGACKCYPVLESLRFRTSVQVPRAKQGNVWYACLSDDLEAQLEAAMAGVADAPAPELPRSRSRSRRRGTFGVTQDGAQGSFARRRTWPHKRKERSDKNTKRPLAASLPALPPITLRHGAMDDDGVCAAPSATVRTASSFIHEAIYS